MLLCIWFLGNMACLNLQELQTLSGPWQRWFLSLLATVPLHFFVLSKSGNEPSQHVINMRRRRRGPPSLDSAPDRQSLPPPSPKGGLGIAGKAYQPPSFVLCPLEIERQLLCLHLYSSSRRPFKVSLLSKGGSIPLTPHPFFRPVPPS